jgi:purine-cytosine permease-like protein
MDLSVVADWFTILFFLWFGLKQFIPALGKGFLPYVGGVLALGAALFIYLST